MIHDSYYTQEEIEEMLRKAAALGFSMDAGSELEKLTLEELERLVTVKQ